MVSLSQWSIRLAPAKAVAHPARTIHSPKAASNMAPAIASTVIVIGEPRRLMKVATTTPVGEDSRCNVSSTDWSNRVSGSCAVIRALMVPSRQSAMKPTATPRRTLRSV